MMERGKMMEEDKRQFEGFWREFGPDFQKLELFLHIGHLKWVDEDEGEGYDSEERDD